MDGERSALDDPLAPLSTPIGFTAPAPAMGPPFNLTRYAAERGILVATLRSKLRKAGFRTPYTLGDVLSVLAE
jgi:hypothetical protein